MKHSAGLRELILTRNKFGDGFAKGLQKILVYDKYLKVIDLAGNRINRLGLNILIKLALADNQSIVAFDARLNPGAESKKLMEQLSLCMIKNIDLARNIRGTVL